VLEQQERVERGKENVLLAPARLELYLVLIAAIIFLGCLISPPGLMDDVDAAHGQLARNMIQSRNWVIPQLDGVPYIEKAPLPYWLIAVSYLIFGVHDWAARIPFALGAVLLCWATARYGRWAFGARAGFYSGLVLATCIGLFLFTRILIPDVLLTLCILLSFWSLQRALNADGEEKHPARWAALLAISLAVGVMLKGLIALALPIGGTLLYLAITRQLFSRETWRKLHPVRGLLLFMLIAAPWHILATLRMPPHFEFTLHSGPGEYHGFLWFYFMNEHVLRFLGLRYPHDYNTVPRLAFWLLNLVWLFPWSLYLPAVLKLNYQPLDRSGRTRLIALCWGGFLLLFFTFSTTQEYYSMPMYPALALLIGSAMDETENERWLNRATKILAGIYAVGLSIIAVILYAVRNVSASGDIAAALQHNPSAYTLSLGHMGDLTLRSFAYLRAPLALAGLACLAGAVGSWILPRRRAIFAIVASMVIFFHASRMALRVFDPYLSSRPLAENLLHQPDGRLIIDGAYYPFSSLLYYSGRDALLLNGRSNNLEYGSYAPGAPPVFIDDAQFAQLWQASSRYYLASEGAELERLRKLAGNSGLYQVAESGGKFLFTNHPPESGRALANTARSRPW
jgi:4-amino-4-deoxy-L-arabinose transferase-like glycosyltransferase